LRKLYEGAQFAVVKHYCAFAVKESSISDLKNGTSARNIGVRASDVVHGYLDLVGSIQTVCEEVNLAFTESDIGSFSRAEVKYKGWWTFDTLGRLGNVSPMTMSYAQFLSRCKDLLRLLEGLKPGPLRSLMVALGISKNEANQHQGLKLSAFLCQFAAIAKSEQWNLISDRQLIASRWDKDVRLDLFSPSSLFMVYVRLMPIPLHQRKRKHKLRTCTLLVSIRKSSRAAGGKHWISSTIRQLSHCGMLPSCFDLGPQGDSAHKYAGP
jgi:hypothetical protein